MGESGSGKSVSMLSIMGPAGGQRQGHQRGDPLRGEDLSSAHLKTKSEWKSYDQMMQKIRCREIGMIFQDPMTYLNPVLRIGTQMTMPLMHHFGMSKEEAKKKAIEMMEKVGIPSPERRFRQYPHEFSGGMRQRIIIAIALSCNPKLIIADEPTTALDVTIQAQVLDLIKELSEASKTSVIMITHDLGVVASLCSKIIIMYGGKIVESGNERDIFYEPRHPYTRACSTASTTPTTMRTPSWSPSPVLPRICWRRLPAARLWTAASTPCMSAGTRPPLTTQFSESHTATAGYIREKAR